MHSIRSNIRQAVTSRGFMLSCFGTMAILLLSCMEGFVSAFRMLKYTEYGAPLMFGYHNDLIVSALSGEAMTITLPILAALPYTTSVTDDIKSGFIKEYLPRTTIPRYIFGKVIGCALSGALALMLGLAMAFAVASLMLLPLEAAPAITAGEAAQGIRLTISPVWGKLILMFASGVFWASIGMLFSNLTMSRYMAYASPFVIYYVLIILYERYFPVVYVLYPKEWLAPSSLWLYGNAGVLMIVAELTALAGLGAGLSAGRRLSNV